MGKNKDVENWLKNYDNPMKDIVLAIREIILSADIRIEECIKWKAPTFTYKGNLASFFPKSKQHASLMFHTGAKIPGKYRLLEGKGSTGRVMKIGSVAGVQKAKKELTAIVRAWCDLQDQAAPHLSRTPSKKTKASTAGSLARGHR